VEVVEILELLSEAVIQKCPNCATAGQKDNACTHISCANCGTKWCYFCGKAAQDIDCNNTNPPNLDGHNHSAGSNKSRCVWYLDFHPLLAGNASAAMAKFHRYKLMRLLREMRDERGAAAFDATYCTLTLETLQLRISLDRGRPVMTDPITINEIIAYPPECPYALP
jgi:hypothetical protein